MESNTETKKEANVGDETPSNVPEPLETHYENTESPERQGPIETNHMKTDNLDNELLNVLNIYFKGMQNGDKKIINKIIHPNTPFEGAAFQLFDTSNVIQSIDKLTPIEDRVTAIADEYMVMMNIM